MMGELFLSGNAFNSDSAVVLTEDSGFVFDTCYVLYWPALLLNGDILEGDVAPFKSGKKNSRPRAR